MQMECHSLVAQPQANTNFFKLWLCFVNNHSKGTALPHSYLCHSTFCWGHWGHESCQVVIMVQNSWSEYPISAWPLHIWALRRCSPGTVQCHAGSVALSSSMHFTQWQHLEEINRHLLYPREGTLSKMHISELPAICVYLEEMEFIFSMRIWCKSSVGKCIELSGL